MEAAEVEAERLLDKAWPRTKDGTMLLPVDPIVIAKKLSILVFEAKLSPDISGEIHKEPGEDPRIVLNRADSQNRKRFTCAHELGHYIEHGPQDDKFEWRDRRGPLAASGLDESEVFANRFAAALLMPRAEVEQMHSDGARVADLAITFGVSLDAMRYRLINLGLLSD